MARTKMLLQSKFSQSTKSRVRRGSSGVRRGTGRSGAEVLSQESDRIAGYITQENRNKIVDINTALEVVDSLKDDSTNSPLGDEDFINLLGNTNQDDRLKFARFLLDVFGKPKIKLIKTGEIILKSGKKRRGFRLNKEFYLIRIKIPGRRAYIQARSFKTGQVVKLDREFLKRIKIKGGEK